MVEWPRDSIYLLYLRKLNVYEQELLSSKSQHYARMCLIEDSEDILKASQLCNVATWKSLSMSLKCPF